MSLDLSKIKPRTDLEPEGQGPDVRRLDEVARRHDYTSREAVEVKSGRKSIGLTTNMTLRCPVRVFNPFVEFCQRNRLTYWEGIERMMQLLDIDSQGKLPHDR